MKNDDIKHPYIEERKRHKKPIFVKLIKDDQVKKFGSKDKCAIFLKTYTAKLVNNAIIDGWTVKIGEPIKGPKIYLFHKTGEYIRDFNNLNGCAAYLCITPGSILSAIESGKFKKYIFSYTKKNDNTFDINDYE